MKTDNIFRKCNDSFDEVGVVSEYENKGLSRVEEKIYSKYLTKPQAMILDVGCFVGRVSFPLADKGFRVFGIDTSSVSIKRANELKKNKDTATFNIASATNIPFKNKSFDYVLFPYNTIEGIPSEKARRVAMQEAARTLKGNGLILFSAHNRLYPKYFIGIALNETIKLMLKVLVLCRLDHFIPSGIRKNITEKTNTEFGSILWVEPGGTKYVRWHFSTQREIHKMLTRSSLSIVQKIPVMDHGPQKINSDLLRNSRFNFIKAPVFYYICAKRLVSEKNPVAKGE